MFDCRRLGVVFDCDGTLLDSMDAWRDMESALAARAGHELTHAERAELCTLTTPEAGVYFHERLGLGSSPDDVVRMIDEYMLDYYSTRSVARPGALAFVGGLAERGVQLSVASSSPVPFLEAGLAHTGFATLLAAVVSVDEVGVPKRFAAVYDRARELMGTTLPFTWGFEDAVYAVRTLKGAGYHAVGIYDCDHSGTREELAAAADIAIEGFEELSVDDFLLAAQAALG